MATNLVAKIIRHRTPATNLPVAHSVPGQKMDPDPDAVNSDKGKDGHKTIYQGGVQVETPR